MMTVFDALLLLVLGVSIFFAAIRGAVRELATLGALAAGGLSGWGAVKPVGALLGDGSVIASLAASAVIAVLMFFLAYLLLHKLMLRMKLSKRARRFDRIGGGVFGLVRALALIGLGFLGYGYYLDEANQPDAVRKALLFPVASASARFFERFAPESGDLNAEEKKKAANAAKDGYDGRDRSGLKEIVTTVTTTDAAADRLAAPAPTDPIADILTEEATSDGRPD